MNYKTLVDAYRHIYPRSPGDPKSMERLVELAKRLEYQVKQCDHNLDQVAYILATTQHEVGGTWKPILEVGPVAYFKKYEVGSLAKMLGNDSPGDGFKYRGRGYCQVTGRGNYSKFEKLLSLPLVNLPDTMLDADISFRVMLDGMTQGLFTGKKLSNYIFPGKTDFVNARRIINGDVILNGERVAEYARFFQDTLRLCLTT